MPELTMDESQRRVCAAEGHGPLLQRDYWARIAGSTLSPSEIGTLLRERFEELAPSAWVRFRRRSDVDRPLRVGDELDVHIRWAGTFGVRVLHVNDNSLTVSTLAGHPEVGRITFGAYRHERGDVVFHIRSLARCSSPLRHLAFSIVGEPMQTKAWTDFVAAVAATAGDGVTDFVYEETKERDLEQATHDADGPTYLAEGD